MASSPSSIPGRRNRPGCMGGIAHLFDFNQALAGRKLLIDKKYGAGLEPSRNTPNDGMEESKPKLGGKGEIQFGKSASASRRLSEVPIKALIAEEISRELARESEPKNRAPSVVARLMGLDALPGDSKSELKAHSGMENLVQNLPSETLQHGKMLSYNALASVKNPKPPPTRTVSDLSNSKRSNREEYTSGFDSLSLQSHSHEQDFKKEFETWQNWNSESHARMQALDDLDSQLAAKQMLIKKKLSEAKLGLSSKHGGPQEKLYESQEFMDAIDFLQANKDFFVRFLEEPDSLFARHMQNNAENPVPENVAEVAKHTRRHAKGLPENNSRPQLWGKEPVESVKTHQKSSETDFQVEKKLLGGSFVPSFLMEAQQKHPDSLQSMEYKVSSSAEHHQAPTRIVVLKPGPGKVRNLMSFSQNSPRSPKDLSNAMAVIKENSMDVLHELKERLQQEEDRECSRKPQPSVHEHYKPSKDPREIAREIARQVRENVTRDLMVNSRSTLSSMSAVSLDRKAQFSEMADAAGGMPGRCDGESCVLSGRGYVNRSSLKSSSQNATLDSKAIHGSKEETRRAVDRLKPLNVERANVRLPELKNAVLERSSHLGDHDRPPHNLRNLGSHTVDGVNVSQNHRVVLTHVDIDGDSSIHSLCESEADAYARNEERVKDDMCRTLLRSRSAPTGFSSLRRSQEEFQGEDPRMQVSDIFVAGATKVVDANRSTDATICRVEHSRRSIFSRKGLGLKGSFSKSRKRTSSNKQVDEVRFACKELPTQESSRDACAESEKNQCQIDDMGPILESDSSVSSLENFLSLEAALMVEDLLKAKGIVNQPLGMTLPSTGSTISGRPLVSEGEERKAQFELQCIEIVEDSESLLHSPSASPKRLASSASDGTMSTNSGVSKDPSEQPSPVSVLDAPFHEESASPMDFTEISSGLQELRMRLRLLKLLDHEAASNSEAYQEEDDHFTNENPFTTNNLYSNLADLDMGGPDFFPSHIENPDFPADGMDCPKGKEPELLYVRNLLIASGFTGNNAAIVTRWHAPSQPLASCIFEKMENNYKAGEINSAACTEEGGQLGSHTRHLLFDIVNEVLLQVLGPQVNCRAWWKDLCKSTVLVMPSGKDLVRRVWAGVCKLSYLQYEAQDTLGNLVAKDLAGKDCWQDLAIDIEIVVLEVERAIFNDLIEETLMVL